MHTQKMASNLVKLGYLDKCEIEETRSHNGYKVVTLCDTESGEDRYTLTTRDEKTLVLPDRESAMDFAVDLGFEKGNITVVK